MKNPLVSVLIAAYNSEKFIDEALQSVWNQTYGNYEVIVVNDGSTDNTLAALEQWQEKITIINKSNGGISSARNAALAVSRGSIIAFLDADDIWLPNKLEEQLRFLEHNPDITVVFSWAQNVLHPIFQGPTQTTPSSSVIPAHIPSNCMAKREVFDQIGTFNETVALGEFTEWYGRVVNAKIGIGSVPSLLVLRRIHGENIGIKEKHRFNDYLHILKKKINSQQSLTTTPH